MIRLCLDLDVLIAAVIGVAKGRANTIPSRLLSACLEGRFALIVSERMLWQLVEALMEEPLNLSLNAATQRLAEIKEVAQLVPGDDALEAARNARADYLISYRRDRYAARAQRESGNRLQLGELWILSVWDAERELGLD